MKTFQYFPLVVSSLVAGGVMLISNPATSAIARQEGLNPATNPIIGIRGVFANSQGRPLNILSFTSSEFPISQIDNNNTTQVNASVVGGAVAPGSPYTFELNYEENPDGTAVLDFVYIALIVATPTGTEERSLGAGTVSSSTSAGATNSLSAFKFIFSSTTDEGLDSDFTVFYQVPGDQLSITDLSFPVPSTVQISSQAIPGYVPFDQLNDFPPLTEFVLQPGENLAFTNPQQLPSTPEPSIVASLSALSFGAFLKRKLVRR